MTGRNPPGGTAPTTAALDPGAVAGVLVAPSVAPPFVTSRKPNRETRREPSRKYRKQGMS